MLNKDVDLFEQDLIRTHKLTYEQVRVVIQQLEYHRIPNTAEEADKRRSRIAHVL